VTGVQTCALPILMLSHYRQTKNMLISYDKKAMGFF